MTVTWDRLTTGLASLRRAEAWARIHVGAPGAETESEVYDRHAWLLAEPSRERLERTKATGQVKDEELSQMAFHLARFAADLELSPARAALTEAVERPLAELIPNAPELGMTTLGAGRQGQWTPAGLIRLLGSEPLPTFGGESSRVSATDEQLNLLDSVCGSLEPALRAAADRARESVSPFAPLARARPDRPTEDDPLESSAETFLVRTDAMAETLLRELVGHSRPTLGLLLRALRDPSFDGLFSIRGRARRIGDLGRRLGLERDLGRVRLEPSHTHDPRPRPIAVEPPLDIRIRAGALDLGAASELALADAFGRALGLALSSPALPLTLRYPVTASVSRSMGTMLAHVLAHPLSLVRERELTRAAADRVAKFAHTILLFEMRVVASARLAGPSPDGRAAGAALSRALTVTVPERIAGFLLCATSARASRWRGRRGGVSMILSLRDRFDEDWFRNPRVEEVLRAIGARGEAASIESVGQEILGPSPPPALWFEENLGGG